jgi:hypothetical protein
VTFNPTATTPISQQACAPRTNTTSAICILQWQFNIEAKQKRTMTTAVASGLGIGTNGIGSIPANVVALDSPSTASLQLRQRDARRELDLAKQK